MKPRGVLVVDEVALAMLATTGQLPWLRAWLGNGAPAPTFDIQDARWPKIPGAKLVIGGTRTLAHAAQMLGAEWQPGENGTGIVSDARPVALVHPGRMAWLLEPPNGGRALLAPPGDFVFARAWLEMLLDAWPGSAVWAVRQEGDEIEPGLVLAHHAPREDAVQLSGTPVPPEETLLAILRKHRLGLRTAESCTAGMLAARIARVPGASAVLERGWIVYANEAKEEMLGVPPAVLAHEGAVSRGVVEHMARAGATDRIVCVAISGIAGPGGGTPRKPVGTVWMAVALGGAVMARRFLFPGSRNEVRARATIWAMALIRQFLERYRPVE